MDILDIVELGVIGFSLMFSIIAFYYTFKTKRRYEKIALKLGNGEDITVILNKYVEQVKEIKMRDEQIVNCFNRINDELKLTVQRVGLYRYDSYNNTKNKLSFALALLNKEGTGIILNSIYGVDDSNIYAKPIKKGTSRYNLSFEEEEAIRIALNNDTKNNLT